MGGYGSGQHRYGKTTVEDCLSLPSGLIAKHSRDFLKGELKEWDKYLGGTGSVHWTRGERESVSIGYELQEDNGRYTVILKYDAKGLGSVKESVKMESTRLASGGLRWWFRCPGCGKRVGILYCRYALFRCRGCHELTYRSCQESHKYDGIYRSLATQTGYPFDEIKEMTESKS